MTVRVIALGNPMARDDGAALLAADRLEGAPGAEVIKAGRAGPKLLDLLDAELPIVLLDVVRRGAPPGAIVELCLSKLTRATIDHEPLSSHGFGVAQSLRLREALGRPAPRGLFLGIGGARFDPGREPTPKVAEGIDNLVAATRAAIESLSVEGSG